MSEYLVCETDMNNIEVILETLGELGFSGDKVSVYEEAISLEGYRGDKREQKGNIVIGRKYVGGAANDIGFEKQSNGSYKAWVSAADKHRGLGKEIMSGRMKRLYSKNMTLRTAKRAGWRIQSCEEEGGKIKMRVSLPR
jgi:hypothetical protein